MLIVKSKVCSTELLRETLASFLLRNPKPLMEKMYVPVYAAKMMAGGPFSFCA